MALIIARVPKTPTERGVTLQALAYAGDWDKFITAFMEGLRYHAARLGFEQPQALEPSLHKQDIEAIAGANQEQLHELCDTMRTELGSSVVHGNTRPEDTLEGMAKFYFELLQQKVAAL